MRREPDERYHVTIALRQEPAHPIEARLWRHVHGIEASETLARAVEIYNDVFERERMQPWVLASPSDDVIAERVCLHVDTVIAYRHLFFNVALFRDLLDKQRWIMMYERRPGATRDGALYLQKALLHGLEAVAHAMGAEVKLEVDEVLNRALRDTHFRSLALRDSKLTGNEMNTAHALVKTAIALAQEQSKVRPPGINDILIRIKNREMTKHMDDDGLVGEILH